MSKLVCHVTGMVALALILPVVCIFPVLFFIISRRNKNQQAKDKLDSFVNLESDWDSYGSPPLVSDVVENSKRVVDLIASLGGVVSWVIPTSDGTVLMMFLVGRKTFKIEIGEDGSIGVQSLNWRNNGLDREFFDATVDNLKEVISKA